MTMVDDRAGTADDATTDEVETEAEGSDRRPPDGEPTPFARWWDRLPVLVVLVLATLVAVGAIALWQQKQDLADERDDRRAAARVASDFTTAVLSYDFRDLDGSVDQAVALATPEWGRTYEDQWFQDLQPQVEATRARARVTVDDVLLGDRSGDTVSAVVTFDARIVSEVGTRRLRGSYLRLDLRRTDGEWKVDQMAYLATTDQSLEAAGDGG